MPDVNPLTLQDAIEWAKAKPWFTENSLHMRYGPSVAEAIITRDDVKVINSEEVVPRYRFKE